jgi:MoaA/NifB/PqqE/SkfB family radical SAM enzyme
MMNQDFFHTTKRQEASFDQSILRFFRYGLKKSLLHPSYFLWMVQQGYYQLRASRKRKQQQERGLTIPPLIIMSITRSCNLHCQGCYSRALRPETSGEMSLETMASVLQQADELGISLVLLAGGEPMMRFSDLLSLSELFPRMLFPFFTNGLLLKEDHIRSLQRHKNLIPILSIEGTHPVTDSRRGQGVGQHISTLQGILEKFNIFFGISLTVDTHNIEEITQDAFVRNQIHQGVKVFFMVEYVPVEPNSEQFILAQEQRDWLHMMTKRFQKHYTALFVSLPGDEEKFGGCLAAGRGFIHINPEGKVEACPFAPFSDSSITDLTLAEALQSPLMKRIRDQHHLLTETKGGCALYKSAERFL